MCGILLLHGPQCRERLAGGLEKIRHRGPDQTEVWQDGMTALGFVRLAITDLGPTGRQPMHYGPLVGVLNGEILNHAELADAHKISTIDPFDGQVLLPLFQRHGAAVIDKLDGFYASIILQRDADTVVCLRDHIGKKPLLVGMSGSELFVTSELKAVDPVDWFEPVPPGAWSIALATGRMTSIRTHRSSQPIGSLRDLLSRAVAKRIPGDGQPLGLFLSGGLDSSIVAFLASEYRSDIRYYCLVDEDSPDFRYIKCVIEAFDLKDVRFVDLPGKHELDGLLSAIVYATESYNPSIVSNGLCTYLLSEAAHRDGVRVVLTGEGADELFGGYRWFAESEPWRETREQLMRDMHFTELRRLDTCSMAHSVEARCPFLDRDVRGHAESLEYASLYGGAADYPVTKRVLRDTFALDLPAAIVSRKKVSFDVGSGVRRLVVEYLTRRGKTEREQLRELWSAQFGSGPEAPYFHTYPVFDTVIDRRRGTHR